jgi:hypothetical protein
MRSTTSPVPDPRGRYVAAPLTDPHPRRAPALIRSLSWPFAPVASVGLALLLASPALLTGFAGDDYFHKLVLTGNRSIAAVPDNPLQMFVWANGDSARGHAMMEVGMTGWWTNPRLVMAYFRPIAVMTHWLDYRLWPNTPWLMHLHSLLWFGVALLVLARFYRRLFDRPDMVWLPTLALFLYAVDDAHAMTLAWIANRNAILAFALGVPVLLLHDRAAHGERRARVAAALVLGLALLAGESALAVAGYLTAYALFLDRARRTRALLGLWPYAAVLGLWAGFYRVAGFGAHGSGLVIDPGADPLRFLLAAVVQRAPVMLAAQVGVPPSDGFEGYPLLAPWLQPAMIAWAWLIVIGFGLAIRPRLRADARARFCAVGSTLAALPVCAQFPHDRLLLFIGLGAVPLVAMLIADVLQPGTAPVPRITRLAGRACIGLHLVLAPLLLPLRVLAPLHGEVLVTRADHSIDESASVRDKTIVLMNPPLDAYAGYLPPTRVAQGRNRPRALRWLATAGSAVTVRRVDARTLRVRPALGFLALPSEIMQRDPRDRMPIGYRVRFSDLAIEVTALTADGRPAEILAQFDLPLEDGRYEFYEWRGLRYQPFAPPRIGQARVLPRVDFVSLLR